MERELLLFLNKLYNYMLDDFGIEADKYEREDAMSLIIDIEKGKIVNGKQLCEAFQETFDLVHGYELTESKYWSRFNLCSGMNAPECVMKFAK